MNAWSASEIAAIVAIAAALGQFLAASWRDLGIVTLAACGAALVLGRGEPSTLTAVLVLVSIGVAAGAWNRGARAGVGRPGLDGLGFALAALCGLWPFVLADALPPSVRERLVEAALVVLGLAASVGLTLALERPGPRRRRPRFFRRVQVVEQPRQARGDPGEASATDHAAV